MGWFNHQRDDVEVKMSVVSGDVREKWIELIVWLVLIVLSSQQMDGHFPYEKLVGFGSHQPLVAEQLTPLKTNGWNLEIEKEHTLIFFEFYVDVRESTCWMF